MSELISITLNDGKYTIRQTEPGKWEALRYGEEWPAFRDSGPDNLHVALAYEVNELRQYKIWYEEAQLVANENGFGPGSAADAIRAFAAEADAVRAELIRAVEICDTWAKESRSDGWSTHQVEANRQLADSLRRAAASGNSAAAAAELAQLLWLFRSFYQFYVTQTKPGANHHHEIWQRVAAALDAHGLNNKKLEGKEWDFVTRPYFSTPLTGESG